MTCGTCSPPCLCLSLARHNLDGGGAGVSTNHWFQIGAALVLCPVGVVDPIIDRSCDRLQGDFLHHPCGRYSACFLPQRSLIPTGVLPAVCAHVQSIIND